MIIGFGVAVLLFAILFGTTAPKTKDVADLNPTVKTAASAKTTAKTTSPAKTSTTQSKPASTPPTTPTSAPTVSLATLNSEAVPILTAATNYNVQLMATGVTDAAQPNPLDTSPASAFEQWRDIVDKPQVSANNTAAYNQATALYTAAKQPIPTALSAWNKDNENTYADIGVWQLGEVTVLVDKESDTSSTSDQAVANTDYQAYQADLAKAQSDISQL